MPYLYHVLPEMSQFASHVASGDSVLSERNAEPFQCSPNLPFSNDCASTVVSQGMVKELIDAIPPEGREKALKLLLAAQKNG